jgi:rhodanese-related sulfurtransferase
MLLISILEKHYRHLPAMLSLMLLTACVTTQDFSHLPPSETVQKAFAGYKNLSGNKAFAAAADGSWAAASDKENENQAIVSALSGCEKNSSRPCTLIAVNQESTIKELARFKQNSDLAMSQLKMASGKPEYTEPQWFLAQAVNPRKPDEPMHYATPTSIKGVRTISTRDLIEKMKNRSLILLDALGLNNQTGTLPHAYSLHGAELAFNEPEKNKDFEVYMEKVLALYIPDKTQAIAVYCASADCWLSVNALIHLRNIGYSNLYWYRGGLVTWMHYELPTIMPKANLIVLQP